MPDSQRGADEHPLLGALAAARYLGVHRSTLHLAVRQGTLTPDERTLGGHVRFRRATLDTYRQRLTVSAATGEAALVAPLRAVRALAALLLAEAAPEEVARLAVHEIWRALPGMDSCFVAVVEPRPGDPLNIHLLAERGMAPAVLEEFRRTRHTFRYATTTVLRTLEAEVCENAGRCQLHTGTRRVSRLWRVGAYAIYPIVAGGRPLGIVNCASHRPRRFNAGERAFFETVASVLALAFQRVPRPLASDAAERDETPA